MKSTATAPSNIAFIKYWGRKDEVLRLPENGSISMNLDNLLTTTTVAFDDGLDRDEVTINGTQIPRESERVTRHLDLIRARAGITARARVSSVNNFPTGTGLSSSASGFAALTVAACAAAGLSLSERDLSIIARQGSGSACRSIPSGFVEWLDGNTSDDSYAVSLYGPDYWDIADVVAVVNQGRKDIPTSEGMQSARTSPFFSVRSARMEEKLAAVRDALARRDFNALGELAEQEALEMHAIMMTSQPSLLYLLPGSVSVMRVVRRLRQNGLPVYFTLNTGQDVHVITEKHNIGALERELRGMNEVQQVIVNHPGKGARPVETHLF